MTARIKKFYWCFTKSILYPANPDLDALVYKCIWLLDNCPNVTVKIGAYTISISTSSTEIELWNANKWYGWLSRGHVNGREFEKAGATPEAMYDFKEALKRHGYNIHVKPKEYKEEIRIDDVAC